MFRAINIGFPRSELNFHSLACLFHRVNLGTRKASPAKHFQLNLQSILFHTEVDMILMLGETKISLTVLRLSYLYADVMEVQALL